MHLQGTSVQLNDDAPRNVVNSLDCRPSKKQLMSFLHRGAIVVIKGGKKTGSSVGGLVSC